MSKTPKRKEYLNDYKQGDDGKYIYSGVNYGFAGTENDRKRAYIGFLILSVILLSGIIGSGLIDAAGANGSYYVIIPYIGEVCSFFAFAWYSLKLIMEGNKIRGYIFKTANERIPAALMILMFFAVFGMCASLIYLAFNGFEGKIVKSILYVILKGFNAILAFIVKKYYNRLEWIIL